MTHILEYMPIWCFWQILFPIGCFGFTDERKTEVAIVRDYKDKPWISCFIMFVFHVNRDIAKFAYRSICAKEVWITACIQVFNGKKSPLTQLKKAQVKVDSSERIWAETYRLMFDRSKFVIYRYRQTHKEKKVQAFEKKENQLYNSFICDDVKQSFSLCTELNHPCARKIMRSLARLIQSRTSSIWYIM